MVVFRGMRVWTIAIVFLVLGLLAAGCGNKTDEPEPGKPANPEELRQVDRLNDMADEMYRLVMAGDVAHAKDKLDEVSIRITKIRFHGIASVEGVEALTEAVVEAKRIFVSVRSTEDEVKLAAAKVRLATDALTHLHQPMWLQHYRGMKDAANRLQQAFRDHQKQSAEAALNELHTRFETIKPSVLISRSPDTVEKLNSIFAFLRGQLDQSSVDANQAGVALQQLQLSLDELFQRRDAEAYMPIIDRPVPIRWIASIGSIIAAVLAYAAWRIFQFERNSFGGGSRHGRG